MENRPQLFEAKEADFAGNKEKSEPFGSDFVVDDTRLELVTSRTSSGCATSCANERFALRGIDFTGFSSSYYLGITNSRR